MASGAFAVRFKDLSRWDPASFCEIEWRWPDEVMRPIGAVLKERKEKVDRSQVEFASLQPITIHFDGSVDRRGVDEGREYTMDLYWARPGHIVVAKIDLKNGAVGLVPDWQDVVVTGHFAVYQPDKSSLVPEYLLLIIQTNFFKDYLWRNKVGAEGRKEVKLDFFESIAITLPDLEVQSAIVAQWQAKQRQAEVTLEQENQLKLKLMREVSEAVGRSGAFPWPPQKVFAVSWSKLIRWGVAMTWRSTRKPIEPKYPMTTVGAICTVGSGGTPLRKNPSYFGGDIPWVKTTEVRGEVITDTEEKLTVRGLENSSARLYPAGSVLVAMYGQGATRGRTAKLGIVAATNQACAVLTEFSSEVESDYVWYYLMSEYENLRDQASGNNQPNLNAAMIADYPLPIPPRDVQRAIIERVQTGREEIARLRAKAEQLRREAAAEVEAIILGERDIEGF